MKGRIVRVQTTRDVNDEVAAVVRRWKISTVILLDPERFVECCEQHLSTGKRSRLEA